ncbi:Sulfotransferase [Mactra antiquata]
MDNRYLRDGMLFICLVSGILVVWMILVTNEHDWTLHEITEDKKQGINVVAGILSQKPHWRQINVVEKVREEVEYIHNANYVVQKGDQCVKSLPDVMIVGVAKCGTMELVDFMSIHPNIVSKKNPYQFPSELFRNVTGLFRIIKEMPCKYHDQLSVLKADSFLGEIDKPRELFEMNPNLKIIAMVREPAARLLSDLTFFMENTPNRTQVRNSKELKEFIRYLKSVQKGEEIFQVKQSIYDEGIQGYLKFFREDKILIIDSDEFKSNPIKVLKVVEGFLGVKSFISDKHLVLNEEKQFYCIRKMTLKQSMVCYGVNRGRTETNIMFDKADIRALQNYYRPHSENFFRILGRRFDWFD